ncbi:MAG: hypothetical protein JOZ07_15810 [Solirubrobacterales bacterium]|nr:hypothetical protein [Solirubrobacterales bacterium]
MNDTHPDIEATAALHPDTYVRIVKRGREVAEERLRAAFAKQSDAHAGAMDIDPAVIEEMLQDSVARADGALWQRSLAEGVMTEFGIDLPAALEHPALQAARAHAEGRPPEPPTPTPEPLEPEPPTPEPLEPEPLEPEPPTPPSEPAAAEPEAGHPEITAEGSSEAGAIPEAAPEPPPEAAPSPEAGAITETDPAPTGDAAATAPTTTPEATPETAPTTTPEATPETAPTTTPEPTPETAPTTTPEPTPETAPTATPVASAGRAGTAAEPPVGMRIGAVHLSGIETLRPGDPDIELRLSEAGLDVLKRSSQSAIGRLEWGEIERIELPAPRRGLRGRRRGRELRVCTARGQAQFELAGVSDEEVAHTVAPTLERLHAGGPLEG